jgi:flagellar biosynthesis/type III secretory pathway M-ring protein FliF/YscJ
VITFQSFLSEAQMTEEILAMLYPPIALTLITIIIIVILVQVFSSYRARMSITREEAYRKLAEQATAAEQKSADEQQKAAKALEEINHRLAAIEKILRDVE